jgi:hypothetical protein
MSNFTKGILCLLLALPLAARERVQGWCEQGNRTITVNTVTSATTTPVQRSFPLCTVTVYITGGSSMPNLYSDNNGTALSDPFTAASTGYWFFYVDDGTYDVQFSGVGLTTYTAGATSAMDPFYYPPNNGPARLTSSKIGDILSVKDYGALGDGATDDTTAIQAASTAACAGDPNAQAIYFPAGTYEISTSITIGCAMKLFGDGPTSSTVFLTVQSSTLHGIITGYSLTVRDMAVNTTPLAGTNDSMAAVARGTQMTPPSAVGQDFLFDNFRSTGFNFGMIIDGNDNNTGYYDHLTVVNSYIQTYTASGQISNPINAGNAKFITIRNNVLVGDGNGDHGIYLIAARNVDIDGNTITNEADSGVKILTAGFGSGGSCPSSNTDYGSWTIRNNVFTQDYYATTLWAYCAVVVPQINVDGNYIGNNSSSYALGYANIYVQSSCQANILHVHTGGNTIYNVGLGGIVLLSTQQGSPCASANSAYGTISDYHSVGDQVTNFSTSSAGTFPAINSGGSNLLRASVIGLRTDSNPDGGGPLNLAAFALSEITDMLNANAPASNTYPTQRMQSNEPGRTLLAMYQATGPTVDSVDLYNAAGTAIFAVRHTGQVTGQSTPGLFTNTGTLLDLAHMIVGIGTLSSGTYVVTLSGAAVYSTGSSYRCVANDTTTPGNGINAVSTTASTFTLTGTGGDSFLYICTGN